MAPRLPSLGKAPKLVSQTEVEKGPAVAAAGPQAKPETWFPQTAHYISKVGDSDNVGGLCGTSTHVVSVTPPSRLRHRRGPGKPETPPKRRRRKQRDTTWLACGCYAGLPPHQRRHTRRGIRPGYKVTWFTCLIDWIMWVLMLSCCSVELLLLLNLTSCNVELIWDLNLTCCNVDLIWDLNLTCC